MRKNMFDILSEGFDFEQEIKAIWHLFAKEATIEYYNGYTDIGDDESVLDCVNTHSFANWKSRNRCISPYQMMERLGINEDIIMNLKSFSSETIITLEFIANMIKRCDLVTEDDHFEISDKYTVLKQNINTFLDQFGHETYYFEEKEQVIIIEKNPAAISAAEISEPEIGKKIIQYNHHILKGNIDAKKAIIIALANDIEPHNKELEEINSSFKKNLSFMFNNMNLRHNNIDPKDKKQFVPYVAKMDKNELESWYDDVYQMILFAKLLLDNKDRQNRINTLKTQASCGGRREG